MAGVWQQFGQGRMPGFEHLGEYAETLREAATEFRKAGMPLGDALPALQAMQALAKLGVEPGRLLEYAHVGERLAEDGEAAPEVIRAALEIQRLEESTGLGYEALVESVRELAERRGALEAEVADLGARRKEVQELLRQRQDVQGKVDSLPRISHIKLKRGAVMRREAQVVTTDKKVMTAAAVVESQ